MNYINQLFKLNILYFAAAVFFLTAGKSNSQWILQNVPANGGVILGVNFKDSLNGIMGGYTLEPEETAAIYLTTNGGVNWVNSSFPNSTRSVTDFQFTSPNTGFATGAYNLPSSLNNNNLFFDNISKEQNRILGMSGGKDYDAILLKTTDAGMSWFTFGNINQFYNYLFQIIFTGGSNALISGTHKNGIFLNPGISKSSDGGLNWDLLTVPVDTGNLNKTIYYNNIIYSVGTEYKLASDYKGVILRSTDYGTTWSKSLFPEVNNFTDIKFVNQNTGYASCVRLPLRPFIFSSIYKTTNGGLSWNNLNTNFDSTTIRGILVKENSGEIMFYGNKTLFDGISIVEYKEVITGSSTNYGAAWVIDTLLNEGTLTNSQYLNNSNVFLSGWEFSNNKFDPLLFKSVNGILTAISSSNPMYPEEYKLSQNYPNPFNPVTKIRYSIMSNVRSQTSDVNLIVYNALGKEVITLVNQNQNAGTYEVDFDGKDLSSGIYFYKLSAGEFIETKSMLLIK